MIPFGQRPVARRPWFLLLPLSLALGPSAAAQIIPIRSVPLAQGDQFLIFPSARLGMGGVFLALADSLLDPYRNPAMGARVGASRLFAAPAVYGISRETGGGLTLPLGLLGRAGPWFGGLSGAIQQVEYSGHPSQLAPDVRATYHGDATTIAAVLERLDFRLQQPLRLSETERTELVAFLKALTDPSARNLDTLVPANVPSGLPVR